MKYLQLFLIPLLAVVVSSATSAQSYDAIERSILNLKEEVVFRRMLDHRENAIEGTPYLTKEFVPGTVIYKDGKKFKDLPLRLNIYINEMEFRLNDKIYALANNHAVEKIIIGGSTFVYERFEYKNTSQYAYFRQIVDGKTDLLVKANVAYLDPQPSQGVVSSKAARFDRRSDGYYLKLEDGYLEKVRSIKKLVKRLGKSKQELTSFVKEHNISSRNEEELTRFVEYYNGLL